MIGPAGSATNDAIEMARPTSMSESGVTARKYSIETGMNTPLPTASTPIAVTKRRCSPTEGKPSLASTRPSSNLKPC